MDFESDNIKHRDEVLSHFRESLTRPLADRFFDEDFLLEVFDYAGDIGDDYLRMEALLCGARFYPDSEEMAQRKAIFYMQYNDDASSKNIADNPQAKGMMWDIIRAIHNMPDDLDDRRKVLDTIATSYFDYTDEEVIQFVELASSYEMMDWLSDNLDMLRKRVQFVNILLYEIAVAARRNSDNQLSAKMLEELTELEPFNHYFWLMLAQVYDSLGHPDKAITAVDYALAINPTDTPSLMTKAELLYYADNTSDEAVEILKNIIADNPGDHQPVNLLACIYSAQGKDILAASTLNDFLERNPDDIVDVIREIVLYRPSNIDSLLDSFYASCAASTSANIANSQIVWVTWAQQLSQNGYADVAERIIAAYERNSGSQVLTLQNIENKFLKHQYTEAVLEIGEYLNETDHKAVDFPTVAIIHLISMIRMGQYDTALDFCKFVKSNSLMFTYTEIGNRLQYLGMQKIVNQVHNKLKRTQNPEDWKDFDPLSLWSE